MLQHITTGKGKEKEKIIATATAMKPVEDRWSHIFIVSSPGAQVAYQLRQQPVDEYATCYMFNHFNPNNFITGNDCPNWRLFLTWSVFTAPVARWDPMTTETRHVNVTVLCAEFRGGSQHLALQVWRSQIIVIGKLKTAKGHKAV